MSFGLQAGTLFAGRYRILGCIATGGMGAVYEVLHVETERRRALKVMLPEMLQSAELRDRFQREAKVAAKIDSEFIVEVFDAGIDEATRMPFLVMELLKGEELGKRLRRQGRFSAVEVVTYLEQTAMALDKTHKASIVHRDLKPDNLFLTFQENGRPRIKVLDFGVAKVIAESATASGGTRSLGTPLYMAPEQFNPDARLTAAADIYALGMMAFTLLVGASYWSDESNRSGNVIAFAMTVVQGPPQPASVRAALHGVTLPPAFDAWFARMTSRDPAARFPTATGAVGELAEALGIPSSLSLGGTSVLGGPASMRGFAPEQTTPLSPGMQSGMSSSGRMPTPIGAAMTGAQPDRRRMPVVVAVVAVVLGGLGGAAFVLLRRSPPPAGGADLAAPLPATSAPAKPAAPAPAIEPAPAVDAPGSSAAPVPSEAPADAGGAAAASATVTHPAPPAAGAKAPPAKPAVPAAKKPPAQPSYSQD